MYRKKRNRISLRIDVRVDDRRLRCNRIGINNRFSKRNYFYVINKEFDSNGIQCFPFKYSNFPIFEIRFSIHNVYVHTLLPRARSLTSFSRYTSARSSANFKEVEQGPSLFFSCQNDSRNGLFRQFGFLNGVGSSN